MGAQLKVSTRLCGCTVHGQPPRVQGFGFDTNRVVELKALEVVAVLLRQLDQNMGFGENGCVRLPGVALVQSSKLVKMQ